jgi:hypothetical protein
MGLGKELRYRGRVEKGVKGSRKRKRAERKS